MRLFPLSVVAAAALAAPAQAQVLTPATGAPVKVSAEQGWTAWSQAPTAATR